MSVKCAKFQAERQAGCLFFLCQNLPQMPILMSNFMLQGKLSLTSPTGPY